MATVVTAGDLLRAGELHHKGQDLSKKAWRAYRDFLLETVEENPADRLEAAVDFLGSWKGLRFKGGGEKLRRIYSPWVDAHKSLLTSLRNRELVKLQPTEFYQIFGMAVDLRNAGLPPTCYGKLLHFWLPRTILLWDGAIVRTQYSLDGDPASFLEYQAFGQRLLRFLERNEGRQVLAGAQASHAKLIGFEEPITRLVDELAYVPELAQRAVNSIGGRGPAFGLPPPQ